MLSAFFYLDRSPQLSLKHSNSVTELLDDLVVQLFRVWQAIYQVMGLSYCHFLFPLFFLFIAFFLTDFHLG